MNILIAHWLAEPDRLQQFASQLWQVHGALPGSGSDAVIEIVFRALDLIGLCGLRTCALLDLFELCSLKVGKGKGTNGLHK